MKLIGLHGKHGQGKFTQVSDEDYEYLNQWKWFVKIYSNGEYARRTQRINGKSKEIKMHNLVLPLADKKLIPDHIDGNGLNNQRLNLRAATRSQNGANRDARRIEKSSKYKGIYWKGSRNKWMAACKANGKLYSSSHITEVSAALGYNKLALKHQKEFARLNIIPESVINQNNIYLESLLATKICAKCKTRLPKTEFYKVPKNGRLSCYCNLCKKIYMIDYYNNSKEMKYNVN